MASSASVRDLRNRFPRVRKLVESHGEVLLTDRGVPRFRLTLYSGTPAAGAPAPKDYLARMKRLQPRPMSSAAARALDEENRGGR
jgi:antitoxin (DNA-binding transcriptional repressor) of toxin-antitoxin stability system